MSETGPQNLCFLSQDGTDYAAEPLQNRAEEVGGRSAEPAVRSPWQFSGRHFSGGATGKHQKHSHSHPVQSEAPRSVPLLLEKNISFSFLAPHSSVLRLSLWGFPTSQHTALAANDSCREHM